MEPHGISMPPLERCVAANCQCTRNADDGDGVLNAKLADFGLHAIVEAADRNETVQRM